MIEHFNLANALRTAVDNDEFRVYYQPIVEAETDEIIGFEALLRWQKPDGYIVAPDEFLTVAEETGLIVPIGTFVLHEACRQLRFWHDAGHGELTMAVNLSGRQFREENLVGIVRGALSQANLDARYLHLELTESILMESGDMTQEILNELRRMGIRIAIDDFGTGYSSLSYLQKFQLDELKIDRSFIKDIARNPNDASITRAIILMAHSLGLEIVAEGIETEAQKEFIREHGCRFAQGYLYSRPVPADQISKMLVERRDPTIYYDPDE
ncbi:MAG: EAL domain-containing protein [Deltaproteobacteria bacterium]|nr:EAL domain-containing protein [Deltaproteobacteria bacterium]